MDAQFYIDRQFGHLIWIDVKDGIITKFPHEGKMESVLNERFAGKSIADFKEEFEETMKPSFHCVKSYDCIKAMQIETAVDSRINADNRRVRLDRIGKVSSKELDRLLKEVEEKYSGQLAEARKNVEIEREILLRVHNFPNK